MPRKLPDKIQQVNIRPGVSVLSVLKSLNYRPWFAIGEFVDNAIQSFLDFQDHIQRVDGAGARLEVKIELDPTDGGRLVIRDTGAGIQDSDFPRAFRAAQVPVHRTGLSEFGMGMKSASCWFSPKWQVRTSALGSRFERVVRFDIDRIVRDDIEELDVESVPADPNSHFTEIILTDIYHVPVKRTVGKIKEHLAEIYRVFTRNNTVDLRFNGEPLTYAEPETLVAPKYNSNNEAEGEQIEWIKSLNFDFGGGLKATGFAGLRKVGSTTHAGFSLFRRDRLIVGSADEKYRPLYIFGAPNDYVYQRMFGELHIEGFEVTHTKDGFQWDENEQPFLEMLKDELDSGDKPLIRQARNFRSRPSRQVLRQAAQYAADRTGRSIEQHVPQVLAEISMGTIVYPIPESLPDVELASRRIIDIEFENRKWRVVLELSDDVSVSDWLEVSSAVLHGLPEQNAEDRELLGLRLAVCHPFMDRFVGADRDKIEPILRVAAALGLGEKLAREGGVTYAGAVRNNVNKLLRDALSRLYEE